MLLECITYKNGRRFKELTADEIENYQFAESEFLWAAFHDPESGEVEDFCLKLKVHELALEDVRHEGQIPKVDEYDDNNDLLTVLHQLTFDNNNSLDIGEVYILTGEKYVVSIRKGTGRGFAPIRKRAEKEPKLLNLGTGFVTYTLMDAVVDRYFPIVNKLEKEIYDLESEIFNNLTDKGEIIKQLHNAKDKIRIARNSLTPLLDNVGKLFGGRVPTLCDNLGDYFRDTHDHLLRLCSNLESLNETVTSSIHTTVALITIDESKVTKKLASWAAIFATTTFMAGLWGMNFKHMPELEWQYGYLFALSSMATVALSIRYKFKKAGWL